jgi:hypothetical protein
VVAQDGNVKLVNFVTLQQVHVLAKQLVIVLALVFLVVHVLGLVPVNALLVLPAECLSNLMIALVVMPMVKTVSIHKLSKGFL